MFIILLSNKHKSVDLALKRSLDPFRLNFFIICHALDTDASFTEDWSCIFSSDYQMSLPNTFTFHNPFIQGIHKRMVRFQKWIKHVCLTLHGHNIHRQRRQLSKCLMRYQQFASPLPPFSQECTSASQSCSSTALDRTCCCKWRQESSPLATPFARSYTVRFLSLGIR
jgi:hypothetical protein